MCNFLQLVPATAIATLIAVFVTVIVNLNINRQNHRQLLNQRLYDILKMALQHPKFESKSFTDKWTSKHDENDDEALRYELYATIVFNYLEDLFKFYNFNEKKIEKELAVKDWVRIHGKYWYDPTIPNENIDKYDKKFVEIVDKYLAKGNAK